MKPDRMRESELIKDCLEGREEAYRAIMDRYHGPAMALALNLLRNRQDAEDACQDAFINAFRNLHRFHVGASFKNWFYAVLYNKCRDQLRKKRRFSRFYSRLKQEPVPVTGSEDGNPGGVPHLDRRLVEKLKPKERISLYLWAQEGFSGNEIASVLKCAPSTARVHLYKARKKIKAILEEEHGKV